MVLEQQMVPVQFSYFLTKSIQIKIINWNKTEKQLNIFKHLNLKKLNKNIEILPW